MSLVRVKTKYQVTLPTIVREQLSLKEGDVLTAEVRHNQIILTPQTMIDKAVLDGLHDIATGKVEGPFYSAAETLKALYAKK